MMSDAMRFVIEEIFLSNVAQNSKLPTIFFPGAISLINFKHSCSIQHPKKYFAVFCLPARCLIVTIFPVQALSCFSGVI
jgi:hypothetical protein